MLCDHLEGWAGGGVGGRLEKEGTCLCLWPVPIVVQQKPAPHCRAGL